MGRKKKNTGSSGGNAATPPKRVVEISSSRVIFPHSTIPITAPFNEQFFSRLKQGASLIIVPELPSGQQFHVGVLGIIDNLRRNNSQNAFHFNFTGEKRVRVYHNEKNPFGDWSTRLDIPISPEIEAAPEFRELFPILAHGFLELMGVAKKAMEGNPEEESILREPFVRQAVNCVRELNSENLVIALDSVMNVLNHLLFTVGGRQINLFQASLMILKEEDVWVRFVAVASLVTSLLGVVAAPMRGTLPESLTDDDEPETVRVNSQKEQVTAPPASKTKETHVLLREELSRPRQEQAPRIPGVPDVLPESHPLIILDSESDSRFALDIMEGLSKYIIGQERAKRQIAKRLVIIRTGLADPDLPLIGGFFAGPTGVGKTELVKALAEFLFDDRMGYIHISCNALQRDHELAYLIGAPPGYIGYDREPVFSQRNLDRPHFMKRLGVEHRAEVDKLSHEIAYLRRMLSQETGGSKELQQQLRVKSQALKSLLDAADYKPGQYSSIILFDEIERATPKLCELLLQGLDRGGMLKLMNGETTDFRNSIFFFTSNIYGTELMHEISGRGRIGIRPQVKDSDIRGEFQRRIWKSALNAVERHFAFNPAFLGRIGKENIIICHPLSRDELSVILQQIHIPSFVQRLRKRSGIELGAISDGAKKYLLDEALDPTNRALGARALQRVFKERVEDPIGELVDKGEKEKGLVRGDRVLICVEEGGDKPRIVFKKEQRNS